MRLFKRFFKNTYPVGYAMPILLLGLLVLFAGLIVSAFNSFAFTLPVIILVTIAVLLIFIGAIATVLLATLCNHRW